MYPDVVKRKSRVVYTLQRKMLENMKKVQNTIKRANNLGHFWKKNPQFIIRVNVLLLNLAKKEEINKRQAKIGKNSIYNFEHS